MDNPNLIRLCRAIREDNMKEFNDCVEHYPQILDDAYYLSIERHWKLRPLLESIFFSNEPKICETLLEHLKHVDINKKEYLFFDYYAVPGVYSSQQPQLEMTALNHAASLGNKDIVDLLLKAKANPNDNSLQFALFVEPKSFYYGSERYKRIIIPDDLKDIVDYKREITNMLLNAGADPFKIECSKQLLELCQFQKFDSKNRFQMLAYAFDAGLTYGFDVEFWKKNLPKILEQGYLNPESRWFALDNLKRRFFASMDESSMLGDKVKPVLDQIQSAKETIKEEAKKSLIKRSELEFSNETIADRYRTMAQRMYSEYKDLEIEEALARIDSKILLPTQALLEDIRPEASEVFKESGVCSHITGFLPLKDAKMFQDAFAPSKDTPGKDSTDNMEISPRSSDKEPSLTAKAGGYLRPQNQQPDKEAKMDISSPSPEAEAGGSLRSQDKEMSHAAREKKRRGDEGGKKRKYR